MLSMNTRDIRKKYLEFFSRQGHAIISSSPMVPDNDPTTLFTGSGMQPMLPYLLGAKHPQGTRIVDSQKCFRAQDMDEVGDNRHTTFFEMLGNWSLGDYFKQEQIPWMFAFLTTELGLDPRQIYVTCFRGNEALHIPRDTEAAELWKQMFAEKGIDAVIVDFPEEQGMRDGKIFYYSEKKNWWSRAGVPGNMPIGEPGGPDTEMFWDFYPDGQGAVSPHATSLWKDEPCHVNCDCGRFMEIGNNVFMEYQKTAQGFEFLPQKNVDFGGGLERLAAAVNNDLDVFRIDVFTTMREVLERVSGRQYGQKSEDTKAFRVILDHIRAATFLIADGVYPGNKDQGYFVRRLMRRAIRYAQVLGITEKFCAEVAAAVIVAYEDTYPALRQHEATICLEMSKEEEKFSKTLSEGLRVFELGIKNYELGTVLSGKQIFDLYQSYGFPFEVTQELAIERGLTIDEAGFQEELRKHQDLSRSGAEKKFKGGLSDHSDMSVKYHTATHLLHIALRKVLGEHVQQKGSNITPERLRFDFSHPTKMTDEELKQVEDLVNGAIARDYSVSWREIPVKDAFAKKVIGFFPDRYDEIVKVYSIGDPDQLASADPTQPTFSQEICGGPHVEHTGVLGKFKITKEEACSAGIRRIKAIVE